MDQLASASAWLESQRVSFASSPMTYAWPIGGGEFQTCTVNATIGHTSEMFDDGSSYLVRVRTRDYLIAAAELTAGGAPTPPVRGHRIIEGDGTIYEVAPLSTDQPEWQWSDRQRTRYRIHTKQSST